MKRVTACLIAILYGHWQIQNQAIAQTAAPSWHLVQPGDTWEALARQYQIMPEEMHALRGINQQQQPMIGSTLVITSSRPIQMGSLVRQQNGSLLQTAVRFKTSPWAVALTNGLSHPYSPHPYLALWLPGGNLPPKDLPVGLAALELSHVQGIAGQGFAMRMRSHNATSVAAKLNSSPLAITSMGFHHVALGGTGAFYDEVAPELAIQVGDGPLWSQPWSIKQPDWHLEQITLTGSAAQIDQESINQERERLFAIWNQISPEPLWRRSYRQPLLSFLEISSNYGARRSYNGGPYRSYHEGVDFAAYGGTPVYAAAGGTAVLAENLYVRGNAVIIDHGLGIYSGYYHLSELLVTPGETVTAGQQIGKVGTTGLSTGNHLHWDFLVNGVWVDAAAWEYQDMGCWVLAGLEIACEPD